MFPLAAWRFLSVIVSFSLSIASPAKLITVDSFTAVSFACFSARSIVNFSSDSKPLKSINVMFSIRVQVVIRSAAGLIGSQDAYTKVNARKAKIIWFISQSACSKYFEKPTMAWAKIHQNTSKYLVFAHSAAVLHACFLLWLDDKIRILWNEIANLHFRDEVEHL